MVILNDEIEHSLVAVGENPIGWVEILKPQCL